MRPRLYKTEAVVLDRKDFGEADRLLTLFTPGLGKVRAIAKGARRTTSRLSGHIELFAHVFLFLAQGRNLDIVTQSQLIRSHERLRVNLWCAALGFQALELVNHFSEERLENVPLWEALLQVLDRLDNDGADDRPSGGHMAIAEERAPYDPGTGQAAETISSAPNPALEARRTELALRCFEARLLDCTGYRPEFRCCTHCRERLQPVENYFHAPSGGVLCPHCAAGQSALQPLSVEAIKMMRLLQDGEFDLASRLRVTGSALRQAETAMRRHISYVLERDLRTTRLVDEVRVF